MNLHFRPISKFAANIEGASAIEFALVAPIMLSLLFSGFEAGWIMTQTIMLDHGFSKASRSIQIGGAAPTYAQYKQNICDEAVILADCESALRLELTQISSASDFPTAAASCIDRSVPIDPITSYNAGQPSQLVFARACFVVDPLTPGLGLGLHLAKDATGGIRLTSTFAFVNEPR